MTASEPPQLALRGLAPAKPTDRLFLALFPDVAARAAIAHLAGTIKAAERLRGAILRPERLHVTLLHLGDHAGLPRDQVEAVCRAAATVDMPPFDLRFDRVASFASGHRRHPLVLRGAGDAGGEHGLRQMLAQALQMQGLGRYVQRRFEPHVTLLYDARRIPAQRIDAVGWRVREFVLVHSLLGRTEYRILGRWALG